MYLHQLAISAIGPFQKEFQIDFSALSSAGLFLLEGTTGAGKSTIIDAIVYALYGSVASASTSDDRMRSDHAADDMESFVDLIFETSHGIFRVVRQPERMRPKKRGNGLTKQQTKVALYRLSVAELETISAEIAGGASHSAVNELALGEHRSSRADEIGAEIVRIIGLTRTQFVQTIVLPQGEFAQFLRSDPEQRRSLLQNVFGTEIYERAQEQLAGMKRDAIKSIESADSARRDALRAYVQATENPDLRSEDLVNAKDDELIQILVTESARLEQKELLTQDTEIAAFTRETTAKEALDTAKALVASFDQRGKLLAENAQLEELAPEIERERIKRDQAVRAAFVLPVDEAAQRAQHDLDGALSKFIAAVEVAQRFTELGPVNGDMHAAGKNTVTVFADAFMQQRSFLEEQSRQSQELRGQLVELERIEAGLPARSTLLDRETHRITAKIEESMELSKMLAARPAQHSTLVESRAEASEAATKLPRLLTEQEQNQVLVEQLKQLDVNKAAVEAAQEKVTQCIAAAQRAALQESELRMSWLGQMAGTIAATLVDGEPCAACGSKQHPAPASVDPQAATDEQVERAELQRQSEQTKLNAAQAAHAAAVARVVEQENGLNGATLEKVESDARKLATAIDTAQENTKRVRQLNQQILEFETQTSQLIAQDKKLSSERAELEGRIAELKLQLGVDQELVQSTITEHAHLIVKEDESASEPITLSKIAAHAEAKAQSIGVLLRRMDEYFNASRLSSERTMELEKALSSREFDSVVEARAVALTSQEQRALEQRIHAHDVRFATVRARLESQEFAHLPNQLNVDIDALREEYAAAQIKARQESHQATTARKIRRDVLGRAETVQKVLTQLGDQRVKVQPIIRMADVASGNSSDNEKSISLATYVLMRRFEEVVEAANARLLVLSDGRFELVRSDHKEDVRSRKMGLALQVIDHDTEKPRDPRTLSGGETFNASLSLALGLADVVTAEAGGIELGTLFIDEGFGTLDPESLEKVISVLGGLREGGRSVGVVSHVETLKQAIPDGISVRRLKDGSSTLTVRA